MYKRQTPRCGSNFLCQLLASTGVLGDPREYFNPTGRRHYDGDPGYPDDPRAQLGRVLTTGRTGNGVYGVKIHPFQLGELGDVDPLAELPRLHVVRMQREDLPADVAVQVEALVPGHTSRPLRELSADCFAWIDELLA